MRGSHHPSLVLNPRPRLFRLRCCLVYERELIRESSFQVFPPVSGLRTPSILYHGFAVVPVSGKRQSTRVMARDPQFPAFSAI